MILGKQTGQIIDPIFYEKQSAMQEMTLRGATRRADRTEARIPQGMLLPGTIC